MGLFYILIICVAFSLPCGTQRSESDAEGEVETANLIDPAAYPCLDEESLREVDKNTTHWHNLYRALHVNTSSICVSERLINSSRTYADILALMNKKDPEGTKGYLNHDPYNSHLGENICRVSYKMVKKKGVGHSIEACAKAWYGREEPKFDYLDKEYNSVVETGHFTMMVWRAVEAVGCAVARGHKNHAYVVCRYYPQGNIFLQFSNNVADRL